MSESISFLSLIHLLKKKDILSSDDVKDLRGIAYLQQRLEEKGILSSLDIEFMDKVYSEIVNHVRSYLSCEDKEQRVTIMVDLEKILSREL